MMLPKLAVILLAVALGAYADCSAHAECCSSLSSQRRIYITHKTLSFCIGTGGVGPAKDIDPALVGTPGIGPDTIISLGCKDLSGVPAGQTW